MAGYLSKKGVYISATDVGTESSPTYTGLTLSGLTASTVIYADASKAIASLANGSGYLLNDGSGGLSWAAVSLSGYLKADGTVPLTADWNVGAFDLTAVDVNTTRVLLGDGTAAAPSLIFASNTDTGLFAYDSNKVGLSIDGVFCYYFGTTKIYINSVYAAINLWSDVVLVRDAAATLQLGAQSNSITTDQIFKAMRRTGTDAVGANLTIQGGNSTGSGDGGSVFIGTTPAGTAGTTANTAVNRLEINSAGDVKHLGTNSQATNIKQASVVVTTTAAATATATNLIPAGSMVVGVTCRNTTAITGDAGFTGYNIGDGSDPDRWGANVNPAINETTDLSDCTITSPAIYAAATSIVITQVGGSTFVADGVVRVTVHYISLTAPAT